MGVYSSSQRGQTVNLLAYGLRRCKSYRPHRVMIKKVGSKYVVVVESGRHMGEYKTKAEAKKRLQQIEFFKHLKSGSGSKMKLKKRALLKR
jgi:hypothetical protein